MPVFVYAERQVSRGGAPFHINECMEEGSYEDRLHKPAQDRKAHTQTVCEEFRPEMI